MAKLAILDYTSNRSLLVDVCDEQVKKLEDVYDSNTEDWLYEEGLDDKLEINVNNMHYIWLDDDDETVQYLEIR